MNDWWNNPKVGDVEKAEKFLDEILGIDDDDDDECERLGHDDETVYEDEEVLQWTCRRCGAEGWDDK